MNFIVHYKNRPVNQLLCDQICGACLLMIDDKRDADIQLIFQFSVDLAGGHIHTHIYVRHWQFRTQYYHRIVPETPHLSSTVHFLQL